MLRIIKLLRKQMYWTEKQEPQKYPLTPLHMHQVMPLWQKQAQTWLITILTLAASFHHWKQSALLWAHKVHFRYRGNRFYRSGRRERFMSAHGFWKSEHNFILDGADFIISLQQARIWTNKSAGNDFQSCRIMHCTPFTSSGHNY